MAAKYEDQSNGGRPGALPRGHEAQPVMTNTDDLLGDTLPPQPLKELLSAGGANLFVLSADTELIETVQRAGGEHYPAFPVHEWKDLEAAILAGRCGIALLDADLIGAKLVDHIKALAAHSSRVVTLVAADRSAAQELMGYLSDRRIHRLLIKPATLGITKLLVESAVNRCLQLRDLAAGADQIEGLGRGLDENRARRWPRAAFGTLIAVAVIAAAAWLWRPLPLGDRGVEPARLSLATSAATASDRTAGGESSARFSELLNRGAQAFEAGRLAAPTGDNALDYYLTILSMEPGERTARARVSTVVDALFAQAESALLSNSLDDAGTALAGVRRADAASTRLAFLEAQLERATAARAAANVAPRRVNTVRDLPSSAGAAQPAVAPPAPTELDSLLVIATARIARGQLLDPVGDSALEYLGRATALNSSDARVVRSRAALAAALLQAARMAVGGDGLDDAGRLIAAAKDLGAAPEASAPIEIELASVAQAAAARRQADWLALAASRLRAGALTEPVGDSALDYLRKVQNEAPNVAGLSEAWDVWVAAQSARARQAIATGSWAAGETALAAMAAAPGGAATAGPLREQLETERLQTQYLAAASPASELNLLEAPAAVYPPDALRQNIHGWVELEFVVDRTGRPKNPAVVAAEPIGRFDQAALAAVAKYRYAPFVRGLHVYERRVRLRLRFALN